MPSGTAGPATIQERLGMKGARARHEHMEGHLQHAPKLHAWLERLLRRWVVAELTNA